jgi:hypothetical protein
MRVKNRSSIRVERTDWTRLLCFKNTGDFMVGLVQS